MTVKDFNYREFANNLKCQASDAFPATVRVDYKDFIVKTIYDFSIKAGEALVNDTKSQLTEKNIEILIQYIAEWIYRKGITLSHSNIPQNEWLFILQTIAGGIYETGKNALIANLDQDTISSTIQGEVETYFVHALNQLKQQKKINEEQFNSISNAQKVAEEEILVNEANDELQNQLVNPKIAKLATLGIILSSLPEPKVEGILSSFPSEEAKIIKLFMNPENQYVQIDPELTMQVLKNLKNTIAPEEAPTQIVKNFQKLTAKVDKNKILNLLLKERPIVQNYVKSCIEGKFIRMDFSPYLAKIILFYLEKQLSIA